MASAATAGGGKANPDTGDSLSNRHAYMVTLDAPSNWRLDHHCRRAHGRDVVHSALHEVFAPTSTKAKSTLSIDRVGLTRSVTPLFLVIVMKAVGNLRALKGLIDFNGYG